MSPFPSNNGKQGFSVSSNARPISTYFQPVKKPEDAVERPKIQIKDRLKSSNLRPNGSPFSPSHYKRPTGPFDLHKSQSTDSLSENLATLKVNNSQPKTPLRDLTTPKKSIVVDNSSDSEGDIQPTRVLRKRTKAAPIIFELSDGDEETEEDDNEEENNEEQGEGETIEEDQDEDISIKKPRRQLKRRIASDSEDMSDADDETYKDEEEKINKACESNSEQVNVEYVAKMYPGRSEQEIRELIRRTGSTVRAISFLQREQNAVDDHLRKKVKREENIDRRTQEVLSNVQRDRLVLRFFNTSSSKDIQDITGCKPKAADIVIEELRPFTDMIDLEDKLKSNRSTSVRYITSCNEMMDGYTAVDQIIEQIEQKGGELKKSLDIWKGLTSTDNSTEGTPAVSDDDEPDEKAGTHLMHLDVSPAIDKSSPDYKDALDGYLYEQPECVNKEMTLKDYQLLGVNWMLLLYRKNISGILADEMGLGKTAQVISFLGRLYEMGETGPHLIIVPSSTMENWLREIDRFCPKLTVRLYHGSVKERSEQRYDLMEDRGEYQIVVTTYNIATSNADDRKFLNKLKCRSMILDEGHMIKNCTSQRYKWLMRIDVPFRLLLTGTPLQNNLQELVSLLIFIMPDMFSMFEEEVRSIFKIRITTTKEDAEIGDKSNKGHETAVQVLSKDRIIRAKKMMTPFVLRRKKQDVLKDLPNKIQIVKSCTMTSNQKKLYSDIIRKSKKSLEEKKDKAIKKSAMESQFESMSNIIIHLRKAADHPLLFRKIYDDALCRKMAKEIMRDVKYWDANEEYIYEDMCIMSDFELNKLCKENKTISQHQLKNNEWMDSGKIDKLKEVLSECKARKEKVLIFSQFTRMLDILEMVMKTLVTSYLRLDGETKVLERQNVIDDFNENENIGVFLLSTKAGGFGINLTSANVVVLYDLDFNPQNDRQAEDRAHRVGQTKDVRIVKLISEDSIEEYILKMADIKLRLDKRISSKDGDLAEMQEFEEEDNEHQKQSLQTMIREAFIQADKASHEENDKR